MNQTFEYIYRYVNRSKQINTHHAGVIMVTVPGGRLRTAGALLTAASASAAMTAVLASASGAALRSTPMRVDDIVLGGVLGIGTAAAAWLALSCLVGVICIGARSAGATWRAGERAVQRYAPTAVRRALGAGVAASLAVGLASGAGAVAPTPGSEPPTTTSASAAAPARAASSAGDVAVAGDTGDLGWGAIATATTTAAAVSADGTGGRAMRSATFAAGADAPAPTPGTDAPAPAPTTSDLGWTPTSEVPAPTATPGAVDNPTGQSTPPAPRASASTATERTPAPRPAPSSAAEPTPDPSRAAAADDDWPWSPLPQPVGPTPPSVTPTPDATPVTNGSKDSTANGPASVVVQAGDTLWSIAATHLERTGEPVSTAAIAAAWPTWYATNADVIGADPDVIEPGQQLVVPAGDEQATR